MTTPGTLPDPIPSILARHSLNLLAAASGIGKTALLASILAQLSRGEDLFGHTPTGITGFGYISADRPWHGDSRLWFEAAGFEDIAHYSLVDDDSFALLQLRRKDQRTAVLSKLIDKLNLPPGSLVVIDPIALFLGGNLLDYDTCTIACIEVQRMLRAKDLTAIGTVHSAKQKADKQARYLRLQDRLLGSMALLGYTSTQMYLAAPEETEDEHGFYTFAWTPHHAPAAAFSLRRLTNGLFEPVEAAPMMLPAEPAEEEAAPSLGASVVHHRPKAPAAPLTLATLHEHARAVLALFPDPPGFLPTTQLITATSGMFSRPSLFRFLDQLKEIGAIQQIQHGRWGRVPAVATGT